MTPTMLRSRACDLVGANPRGPLGTVSLAVKAAWENLAVSSEDALLIACSGGADSLALAVGVADLASRRAVPCYSLTVDHALREGSTSEASRVAATLRAWGVRARTHHYPPMLVSAEATAASPHPTMSAHAHPYTASTQALEPHAKDMETASGRELASTHGLIGSGGHSLPGGPEAYARSLRYAAFAALAQELRTRHSGRIIIMLGHTADDQAETVLLRLARGSGVGSLRAIAPTRPWDGHERVLLSRPLLGVRRADTQAACEAAGLTPVEDPTNHVDGPWRTHAGGPLPRSAVRHLVIPALHTALGTDPVGSLARTAQQAAEDDDALTYFATQAFEHATQAVSTRTPVSTEAHTPHGGLVLDAPTLAAHPTAVRLRALHHACLIAGARPGSLTAAHLRSLDALLTNWHGQGPLTLPGIQAVRKSTQLTFWRA